MPRLELEAIGAVILAIAVCFGLYFYDSHEQALGAASVTSAVQAATSKAQATNAADAATTAAEQASALHEATTQNAMRETDARDLATAVAGLRWYAVHRPSVAAEASAAAGSSTSIGAGMVQPDVLESFGRALADTAQDASDLALSVDALSVSGKLCVRDYGALKP